MSYLGRGLEQVDNISKLDNITFNGGTTYALTKDSAAFTPISSNALLVSIDGVIQQGNFSVSGTNIVFNFSPTSSNTCDFIMHYGTGIAFTPADSSITKDKTDFISTSSSSGLQIKGDGTTDGTLQLNCSQNTHGIKLKSPNHASSSSYTITFPATDPSANKMLQTDGSGNLSFVDAPSGTHVQLASVESTSSDTMIAIQDKFTTTYDFYRFFLMWKQTTDGSDTRFRWLKSGSTEEADTKYIYTSDRHQINTSSTTDHLIDHSGYNQSYALVANYLPSNSEVHFHTLDWTIYNPYKGGPHGRAKVTGIKSYVRTDDVWRGGTMAIDFNSGNASNQYGGFKLWPSSGYMTDYKYQLYGVKFS